MSESEMGFPWPCSRCQRGHTSSRSSRRGPICLSLQLLEVSHIPWLMVLSWILRENRVASSHPSLTVTLLCLSSKDTWNYTVCVCVCVCMFCVLVIKGLYPGTVAHQASLSMEFSGQEYWSGLPFPSPGDPPNSRIKPESLTLQADSLSSEPPGKLHWAPT